MGRRIQGFAFESEISESLKHYQSKYDFIFEHMVDTNLFDFGIICDRCGHRVHHNLIIPKAVADFWIASNGKITFLEAKSSRSSSFPISNIREHQLSYALKMAYYNIDYWFMICDRRKPRHHKAYALKGIVLDEIMSSIARKRKSIPWSLLEEHKDVIAINKLKGGIWELDAFISSMIKHK